jgi:hypothetical protein
MRFAFIALVVSALSAFPAHAQQAGTSRHQSPADIVAAANRRATEMEQLRSALRSPDQSVRIATYSAVFDSGDPAMMNVAFEEGVLSTDATVKTLTFRAAFAQIQSLPIEIVGQYRYAGDGANRYSPIASGIQIRQYDVRTGQFSGPALAGLLTAHGNVSGSSLSGQIHTECSFNMENQPGTWEFMGNMTCRINEHYFNGTIRTRLR